jgi:hypothetical protein
LNASTTIDGIDSPGIGRAISGASGATSPQTIVRETAADLSASTLSIKLVQRYLNDNLLGRFRLSTTSDDRGAFADGLQTGGDVTAAWTVLESPSIAGIAGMMFTTLVDNSVLVGDTISATAIYELTFNVNLVGVTGLRLDALADPSPPAAGPGIGNAGGNFVLTEVLVSATAPVPVPAAAPPLAGGLALPGLIGARRRG